MSRVYVIATSLVEAETLYLSDHKMGKTDYRNALDILREILKPPNKISYKIFSLPALDELDGL